MYTKTENLKQFYQCHHLPISKAL